MHRLLLAGALLVACVEPPTVSVELQQIQQNCDEFLCGDNGTTVIGLSFGELHQGGLPVSDFRIIKTLAPDGDVASLDVTGPWPRILTDEGWKSGDHMVGTRILLETPHKPPYDTQYWLEIIAYQQIPYWDGLPGPRIAGFDIRYTYADPTNPANTIDANVCPHETVDEQGIAGTWAIMSKGDRFSNDASIVATGAAVGGYFNLSCSGSVIAKLLRIRHAFAARDGLHDTKLDQRKAALRMFTAKYCKEGELYTIPGKKLTWEDYAPWSTPVDSNPEAIWTADGAYCLLEPRYVDREKIACEIPKCTDAELLHWRARGWLQSRIPK